MFDRRHAPPAVSRSPSDPVPVPTPRTFTLPLRMRKERGRASRRAREEGDPPAQRPVRPAAHARPPFGAEPTRFRPRGDFFGARGYIRRGSCVLYEKPRPSSGMIIPGSASSYCVARPSQRRQPHAMRTTHDPKGPHARLRTDLPDRLRSDRKTRCFLLPVLPEDHPLRSSPTFSMAFGTPSSRSRSTSRRPPRAPSPRLSCTTSGARSAFHRRP